MNLKCHHGQLARSCEVCERDAELADLRAQLAIALQVNAAEREVHQQVTKLKDDLVITCDKLEKERDQACAQLEGKSIQLVAALMDYDKAAKERDALRSLVEKAKDYVHHGAGCMMRRSGRPKICDCGYLSWLEEARK